MPFFSVLVPNTLINTLWTRFFKYNSFFNIFLIFFSNIKYISSHIFGVLVNVNVLVNNVKNTMIIHVFGSIIIFLHIVLFNRFSVLVKKRNSKAFIIIHVSLNVISFPHTSPYFACICRFFVRN